MSGNCLLDLLAQGEKLIPVIYKEKNEQISLIQAMNCNKKSIYFDSSNTRHTCHVLFLKEDKAKRSLSFVFHEDFENSYLFSIGREQI